jgi:hypothetical protein
MSDSEFDAALVAAAFELGAAAGWRTVTAAAAAKRAGLDLAVARTRFGHPAKILIKFGRLADAAAITGVPADGSVRDKLFDILMRRFDFLQAHRAGVLALLRGLPLEPGFAVVLAQGNAESMGWLLEAAGVSAGGIAGQLRRAGLGAVWAYGVRAWTNDETADLTATMAAVDTALNRADMIAARFSPAAAETDASFSAPLETAFPAGPSEVA